MWGERGRGLLRAKGSEPYLTRDRQLCLWQLVHVRACGCVALGNSRGLQLPLLPSPFIVSQHLPIMHARSTASSSSNLQSIFNTALQEYESRTKINLLTHPLAARLQSRDTPDAIITLLREQVKVEAQDVVDKLTKWLDPFVNSLHSLSAFLGEGVSLVCINSILQICTLFRLHRLSPQQK